MASGDADLLYCAALSTSVGPGAAWACNRTVPTVSATANRKMRTNLRCDMGNSRRSMEGLEHNMRRCPCQ